MWLFRTTLLALRFGSTKVLKENYNFNLIMVKHATHFFRFRVFVLVSTVEYGEMVGDSIY